MNISDFIQTELLLPRLKRCGVLVVYDPDRRYRDLCLALGNQEVAVVDASESSIESREAAMRALGALGQPDGGPRELLVYVPARRPAATRSGSTILLRFTLPAAAFSRKATATST